MNADAMLKKIGYTISEDKPYYLSYVRDRDIYEDHIVFYFIENNKRISIYTFIKPFKSFNDKDLTIEEVQAINKFIEETNLDRKI